MKATATQSAVRNPETNVSGESYTPGRLNAPLVEFTLEPRGEQTHLKIVESGLDSVDQSDDAKKTYLAEHTSGWSVIAERLRLYAAEQKSTVVG